MIPQQEVLGAGEKVPVSTNITMGMSLTGSRTFCVNLGNTILRKEGPLLKMAAHRHHMHHTAAFLHRNVIATPLMVTIPPTTAPLHKMKQDTLPLVGSPHRKWITNPRGDPQTAGDPQDDIVISSPILTRMISLLSRTTHPRPSQVARSAVFHPCLVYQSPCPNQS